jgi:4,5-dihydroxyphthalate decarboxylase
MAPTDVSAAARARVDRRTWLKGAAATLAAAGTLTGRRVFAQSADPLSITAAGYRFDRTAALFDGRIGIEGCAATFVESGIGDMNTHAFNGPGTRELTEIGLHPYMLAYANEGFRDYLLLPVFLLRQFRHKSVFIRTDRGIRTPQDLRGRRIATPGYSSTSLTWIRGIFEDEYGLAPSDVEWVMAAGDSSAAESGAMSAQENRWPEGISVTTGPPGLDESDLLTSGEVDALFHAATPRAYLEHDPIVARLFPDYRSVEQDYYVRTGIFPIMHALAIRADVAEEHPWLVKATFDAYARAKAVAYATMDRLNWVTDMLPWYVQELENTRALMGNNFYSYGIPGNRRTLETLFRYSHRQGLASRELTIEELFHPASLEFVEDDSGGNAP